MDQLHPKFSNLKGFYEMFKERTKARSYDHFYYYPEDIIRNEFSLQEQEVKKRNGKFLANFLNSLMILIISMIH